ncbi:PDS5A (predicted), partial [Pycnogonum litorale]
ECLSWIRNKVLHVYYQTALEDRLLVERILHTCLVPYNLPSDQRMKKLFQLYSSIDNNAVKAFNELLKCQNVVRNQVRAVIDVLKEDETPDKKQSLHTKIAALSKSLPESVKCQEFLKKFCALMTKNETVRNYMETIVRGDVTCKEAESSVKEVLKACGMPVMTNSFYTTIKQLLERVAPMVVDRDGVLQVIGYIEGCISSGGVEDPEPVVELLTQKVSASQQAERGLRLLLTLTSVFPMVFQSEDVILPLIKFLDAEEGVVSELSLQIITNVGENLENIYPNIAARLMPILLNFIQHGNVKQAKSAVKCLDAVVDDKQSAFKLALEHLKNYLSLDSKYFRTALVSIGQIAYLCSDHFGNQIKSIVYKTVVKDLLMTDKEEPREEQELWMGFDMLPEETRVKMEGMKMLVKWLLGLKNHVNSARSALRLLSTCIRNKGDLMEKGHVCPGEKSWLRLTAATCMLKLVQESSYADVVTHEQFQGLAALMKDECKEVRERFATKLHKRLLALKLPLEYLGILSLAGHESSRETKIQIRHYLWSNINKRRDYLKQHPVTNTTLFSLLPDYVLPYTIHLLAHDNDFKRFDNVQSLLKIRDNLWFIMEPLMMRNENYSFSFFKRLIDNIKQTEDAQNPKDDASNKKLYAVCDLALSLVMSKTTNFILKEYPVEPLLPNKLYVNADPTHGNTRSYLPSDFQFTVPKRSRMETELAASKSKTRPIIQPKSNGTEGDEVTHDDIEHEPASKRTKGNEESKENASPDDGCVMDNSQDSSLMQSKRGRGRLPKPNVKTDPIEVSTQTVDQSDEIHDDDDDDIDSFSSEQTSTAKRGRGRPPKIPAAATTGRRSPKLSSSDSESATKRSRKKPKYLEDDFEEDPGSADDDSDGESKTSNSELKRRPGRPVKNKSDSTSSSLLTTVSQTSSSVPAKNENNSTSSSAQTNSSQTSGAVRTRGRPPKPKDSEEEEEDDFKEEEVTAKRGRGRRPQVNKTSTEESEVDNEESSGVQEPKRGRGRPSKTNTPSVEETDDTEEENIHEVKRAVGRLSKSTEEADKEENVQEVKRGRGRPSKTNTPSVEETDDTEEENIHEIRRAVGRLSKSTKEADEEEDVQEVKRGRGRPA